MAHNVTVLALAVKPLLRFTARGCQREGWWPPARAWQHWSFPPPVRSGSYELHVCLWAKQKKDLGSSKLPCRRPETPLEFTEGSLSREKLYTPLPSPISSQKTFFMPMQASCSVRLLLSRRKVRHRAKSQCEGERSVPEWASPARSWAQMALKRRFSGVGGGVGVYITHEEIRSKKLQKPLVETCLPPHTEKLEAHKQSWRCRIWMPMAALWLMAWSPCWRVIVLSWVLSRDLRDTRKISQSVLSTEDQMPRNAQKRFGVPSSQG